MSVINFELFKGQKELEKEYMNFMTHCNRYFGTDVSPEGVFKRLYFATRYLEGTVNGYSLFTKLGLTAEEYSKGTEVFCAWLENIISTLKQ